MQLGTFTEADVLALARKTYLEGVADFPILPEKCALLVIDMQDEFVRPHWTPFWVPEATRQVGKIQTLIEHCRSKQIPVIFTAFARTHHYLDRPLSGSAMPNRLGHLDIDHAALFCDGQIWHELCPREDEVVIYKPSYGAFYDTPLETMLRNLGKDTIVISGTLTNFCCGTTARQGYERGFKVVFGSDVTATDDPSTQEAELQVLRKGFACVLTAEEILQALT
jgi:nicotinamidase-related amidase